MKPLLNIPKEQIPAFKEIARFPKGSIPYYLAYLWIAYPLLLPAAVLFSVIQNLLNAKPFLSHEDLQIMPMFVILFIPLFYFTFRNFLEEKHRHQEKKDGKPTLAAFFSKDALLWRDNSKEAQYIPLSCLEIVEVMGSRGSSGGGSFIPTWIEFRGPDLCLRIEDAYNYEIADIIKFLRAWKPNLTFIIDRRLSDYRKYEVQER